MRGSVGVLADGFSYLAGPRWHDGLLWLSDVYAHRVYAIDPDGGIQQVIETPGQPGGLGWLPDGRLLVVSMLDHRILRWEPSGEFATHADLAPLGIEGALNDLVVGPSGKAYVGAYGFDLMGGAPMRPARLCRVDPDGDVTAVADDLYLPSGMVLLPDSTLVVAETFGNRLTAFDVGTDGSLSNRRPWASFGDPPSTHVVVEAPPAEALAPGGICADNDGLLWVADVLGNRVVRLAEGGRIADQISTGDLGTYACMLGGVDGRTLYLCTAPSFAEHERRDTREATLRSVLVTVPHGALP